MTIKFILRTSFDRYYLAPGKGLTEKISEAHRFEAGDLDLDGEFGLFPNHENRPFVSSEIRVAPESALEVLALAKQQDEFAALIEAGQEALAKTTGVPSFFLGADPEPEEKEPEYEETELESGQTLRHHIWEKCDLPCPLHMASNHPLRRADRGWSAEKRIMKRRCVHDVWHPDPDDIKIREVPHMRLHSCCPNECCKE